MVSFQTQNALRKAAVLVSALDHRTADVVLDRLPAEHATRIRNAVMQLGDVTDDEQQTVLREFLCLGNTSVADLDTGVELDASLAHKLSAAPAAGNEAATSPLFRTLQFAAPESLALHLKQEHPQIIAVVLAHLPPERSAEVVKRLPERLQVDVLRRVAELDRADPHVLRDLEFELEQRLSDEIRAAKNRSAGLSAVTSILAAAGSDREVIVRSVSRLDERFSSLLGVSAARAPVGSAVERPGGASRRARATGAPRPLVADDLSGAPTDPPGPPQSAVEPEAVVPGLRPREVLPFADLELLDDRGLTTLFATADADLVLVALSGASESLMERMVRQLPARQARLLRRSMERLGPLRLSDIEHAQRRIAALASELITQGTIVAPAPRRWAAAA